MYPGTPRHRQLRRCRAVHGKCVMSSHFRALIAGFKRRRSWGARAAFALERSRASVDQRAGEDAARLGNAAKCQQTRSASVIHSSPIRAAPFETETATCGDQPGWDAVVNAGPIPRRGCRCSAIGKFGSARHALESGAAEDAVEAAGVVRVLPS